MSRLCDAQRTNTRLPRRNKTLARQNSCLCPVLNQSTDNLASNPPFSSTKALSPVFSNTLQNTTSFSSSLCFHIGSRFSRTVPSKNKGSCGSATIPSRTRVGARENISTPSTRIDPSSGSYNLNISPKRLDLPLPVRPQMATLDPGSNLRFSPSKTLSSPYEAETFEMTTCPLPGQDNGTSASSPPEQVLCSLGTSST